MPAEILRVPFVLLVLALAGCGGTAASPAADGGPGGGGAGAATKEPRAHRATATACPTDRDAGMPITDGPPGACTKDADCTAGANGRCLFNASLTPACSYDQCVKDGDCGGASVCACRSDSAYGANVCFAGNCKVDLDCGARGWCSGSATSFAPSCLTDIAPGSIGFFCHTPADTCTNDEDCPASSSFAQKCIFDVAALHWVCVSQKCTA
jgi:hypothetical protein